MFLLCSVVTRIIDYCISIVIWQKVETASFIPEFHVKNV